MCFSSTAITTQHQHPHLYCSLGISLMSNRRKVQHSHVQPVSTIRTDQFTVGRDTTLLLYSGLYAQTFPQVGILTRHHQQ